ncbi:alpha/beta fold hydrolase [Sphaerisporangium perillae]|uniref:alpha/beta fold hydrolase n=1 Tax=Sphaerisporangium perillae TaxID=2935860 RepID=UPI00200EF847|nr:alpha/beta hydrolase [Sphaerisporangium perillae]
MSSPVVFIHGIRVGGTMWGPVRSHLDRPSEAPDLPGHGTRRGEPFTLESAADTVAAAVDRLGGRALLVGLSLGGYVGIATAARFPERVAGLVAMGCTTKPDGVNAGLYRFAASLAARHPDLAGRLSAYAFHRALPGPPGDAVIAGGFTCEVMPSVVEAVTARDPLSDLAAYPGRVWLVNGSRDPFRRHERAFLRACRDGRLLLMPGRNHLTVLAHPARMARLVEDLACLADQRDRPLPARAVATPSPR